jgi:SPX domain protein involved in polyphosphate accumulation
MKFGAQLKSDAIPEWKSAYLNYKALKKRIGKIEIDRKAAFTSTIVPMSDNMDNIPLNNVDQSYVDNILTASEDTFFPQLDAEINKVEEFVRTNITSSTDRLTNIQVLFCRILILQTNIDEYLTRRSSGAGLTLKRQTSVSSLSGGEGEEPLTSKKTDSFKRTVRSAIQELYRFFIFPLYFRFLELLNNYITLNNIALYKILKKFDKVFFFYLI